MRNSAFRGAEHLAEEYNESCKWVQRYNDFQPAWRRLASKYYGIELEPAKKNMQPTLYMDPQDLYAPPACKHRGVLPWVACLAADATRLRRIACEKNPNVVDFYRKQGRPWPERSAFATLLQERENQLVRSFMAMAGKCGYLETPVASRHHTLKFLRFPLTSYGKECRPTYHFSAHFLGRMPSSKGLSNI